jgi:hypothetical protein
VVAFDALAFDVEKAQIHKPAGFHFHVASARLVAAVAEEGAVEGAVESERSLPPVATGAAPQPQPHHVTLHNIIKKVTQFFKPREEKQDPTLLFVNTLLQGKKPPTFFYVFVLLFLFGVDSRLLFF